MFQTKGDGYSSGLASVSLPDWFKTAQVASRIIIPNVTVTDVCYLVQSVAAYWRRVVWFFPAQVTTCELDKIASSCFASIRPWQYIMIR
jgi:hypothetical protein